MNINKLPLIAISFLILTSCAHTPPTDLAEGYLCCNMRTDGSWISDSNYKDPEKTTIPVGTPVKFSGFGRNRVHIEVNGRRQSIGNDYSRDLTIDAFAKRYIVKDDPRSKLATGDEKIRTAVLSARVTVGMSRDQVLMALGYPISTENPHLDAPLWKYWLRSFSPFEVHFDGSNLVSRVTGDDETLRVIYLP